MDSSRRLGLHRILDRSFGFPLQPKSRLGQPLKATAEGLGAHQRTKSFHVESILIRDIYLPDIRVRDSPIPTRLQCRGRSLKKIESGLSRFTDPLGPVQPRNDQMWLGIGVQEAVPFHCRHCSHPLLKRALRHQTKTRPGS